MPDSEDHIRRRAQDRLGAAAVMLASACMFDLAISAGQPAQAQTHVVYSIRVQATPTGQILPDPSGLDISPFSKIRVYVQNFCGTGSDGEVGFALESDDQRRFALSAKHLDQISIPQCGGTITRTYDIPGSFLRMQLFTSTAGANPTVEIQVYGR